MDVGEGMIAMVRGLKDSSLTVTLLDGNRKYTLMPNNAQFSNPTHVRIVRKQEHAQNCVGSDPHRKPARCEVPTQCPSSTARCETAAQATDGRYASMYKTTHCHMTPTSPPVELTEFPPQRAELSPGHDNFEVGGAGSGDTYTFSRTSTNFRGGMSWTDRGSVYEPRSSTRPNAFANSLRKYPSISPERSTEIVERLISYSQSKNAKNNIRSQTSPSRVSEASSYRTQKTCEYEPNCRTRKDEPPTRDRRHRKSDLDCSDFRKAVFRNYDIRYFKEVTRRTRDSVRNLPMQNTNSVNMEIQAVAETASKEVATAPRTDPSTRNVAVSLSPATSSVKWNDEGEDRSSASYPTSLYKTPQTDIKQKKSIGQFKPVKTSSSSIQLPNQDSVCICKYHNYRKTKSEEEIRKRDIEERNALFPGISNIPAIPKRMFSETQTFIENRDRFFSSKFKYLSPLCKECVNSKYNIDVSQAEIRPLIITDDHLEVMINEWLKNVPIKSKDLIGKRVNPQQITRTFANRIKVIMLNAEDENALKLGILKLIQEIPIYINNVNKETYINSLADRLVLKCTQTFELDAFKDWKNRTKRYNNKQKSNQNFIFKNDIQPTEDEVKGFVREILLDFFYKSNSICSKRLEDIEIEIIDILIDYLTELHIGNERLIKNELFFILHGIGLMSENQAILLTDILLERFKLLIKSHDYGKKNYGYSQKFVVLSNMIQNSPSQEKNTTDFSIKSINQRDIDAFLDFYINQLTQEISSWLSTVLGPEVNYIREVVVNDLAGDIVDRLKYLEKNPAKQGTEKDELEVLKFQIYKGINKLVSDDAVQQIIERANELRERLRTIPVPMLSSPKENGYTLDDSLPPCCVSQSTLKTTTFHPDPWLKKPSVKQLPENSNAPGQSGRGARGLILKNSYIETDGNTPETAIGRNSGNLNLNQTPIFAAGPGGSIQQPSSNRIMAHRRQSVSEANNLEHIQQNLNNINLSQMPKFGPAGGGGSMIESPRKRMYTNRRFSTPGAFASIPITQDIQSINNDQMSTYHPTGQLANAIQVLSNQNLTASRPPSPWSFASAPMFQNSENVNLSQTPMYTSSGPRLNMSQLSKPKSPDTSAVEYVAPMFEKYNVNQMPMFGISGAGGSMIYSGSSKHGVRKMSGPGAFDLETRARGPYQPPPISTGSPVVETDPRQSIRPISDDLDQSVDRLNIEYDQFLKDWVKELPLPTNTPNEKTLADTIRSGFYNGVWKAVLKIKLDPTKYADRVYFQDFLDEEIQKLFDLLPETQELERNKDSLKANLLQQSVDIILMILAKSRASNYKQQLIEQVSNHLPNRIKASSDFQTDRHEDLQKMQLVDAFILYNRYKEADKVRAHVFRKKFTDCVEDIFRNVKNTHKASLVNVDIEVYKNELINALHKVPLPTPDVINKEANEILLGIEIEKWFADLPIVTNNDPTEQLNRRRIQYAFAKQIHNMGKQINFIDDSSNEQLKIAVKRFLQKLPLQPNENINLDFMAEEFANRLKNRARENVAQRHKSVSFEAPALFDDFAKHVLLSSSVAEVNSYISDVNARSQYSESYRSQSDRPVQIVDCYQPETSQPQRWLTLYSVTPGLVNSELPAPLTSLSRQEAQESRQLPYYSQQAGRTIIHPQQQIIPQNQILSSNQVIQEPVLYTEAPERVQRSPQGLIPVVYPVTTNEAQIITEGQPVLSSGFPNREKSNRIVLNVPEVLKSTPQIPSGSQQVPQTSNGSVHQTVPNRPIGILGISQTAGTSGRPPIAKAPKAPICIPNIFLTEPTLPNLCQKTEDVLNPPMPYPQAQTQQSLQPHQVPASNVPTERGLQDIPASQQAPPASIGGIFYMKDQPVAYSTPEHSEPPRDVPPKLEKKKPRNYDRRTNGARRRLDLEDTEESESDEVQCRCMENIYKCRRRRSCYGYDDYNIMECPRFFPMRYFHPYFF